MSTVARVAAGWVGALLMLAVHGMAAAAPATANTPAPVPACAGFPRVGLQVPAGYCVAKVADASQGLRFPRRMIEVGPGRYWLVDMGGWEPNRGRLLELRLAPQGETPPRVTVTLLADKLDRPHGLAQGPDGRVYVGEAGKVWRTRVPDAPAPMPAPQTVVDGLPADGAHPLKELVFGAAGQLFISVGSATDACRDDSGTAALPCPELQGERPRAAVYLATLGGPDHTLQSLRPWATGLRNSMALAFVPGPDMLLQGENSIDYPDAAEPAEELNLLRDGQNHGWPYCVGVRRVARSYQGRFDCKLTEPPVMLWPAHVAPLQMLAVPRAALHSVRTAVAGSASRPPSPAASNLAVAPSPAAPASPYAGQLLVAWHGHRAAGHRVVSFALDAHGRASGAPREWVGGWQAVPGVRPQGAPTGLLLDSADRLFILEDRNRSVLMLVREAPAQAPVNAPPGSR